MSAATGTGACAASISPSVQGAGLSLTTLHMGMVFAPNADDEEAPRIVKMGRPKVEKKIRVCRRCGRNEDEVRMYDRHSKCVECISEEKKQEYRRGKETMKNAKYRTLEAVTAWNRKHPLKNFEHKIRYAIDMGFVSYTNAGNAKKDRVAVS